MLLFMFKNEKGRGLSEKKTIQEIRRLKVMAGEGDRIDCYIENIK